jgi:hypothetical protein
VWSSVVVALITVAFAPFGRHIPLAALAGILMVTAYGMIDWRRSASTCGRPSSTRDRARHGDRGCGDLVEFCILIGVLPPSSSRSRAGA